ARSRGFGRRAREAHVSSLRVAQRSGPGARRGDRALRRAHGRRARLRRAHVSGALRRARGGAGGRCGLLGLLARSIFRGAAARVVGWRASCATRRFSFLPDVLRQLFVTTPAGAADLAAQELRDTGVTVLREVRAGVECAATLEQAYELCLWSRVATRILLPLATFAAATPEALYEGARGVDWSRHLTADGTLAVDCTIRASALTHTQFAALKLKDAIVD